MSELWELYQAWVADELLQRITDILGHPIAGSSQGTSLAQWADGAGIIELRYQPFVPGSIDTPGAAFLGLRLLAVIGSLQPDVLLIRREQAVWRAVVVDAKKRSGELLADELSAEASKYLWGIRRASAKPVVPTIEGVILAAPLGGASATHVEGLATAMTAHPGTGFETDSVLALLDLLRGASKLDNKRTQAGRLTGV